MAQGQLAQQTDDQVQGDGHDNVGRDWDQHVGELAARLSAVDHTGDDGIENGNGEDGDEVFAEIRFLFLHMLTPSH